MEQNQFPNPGNLPQGNGMNNGANYGQQPQPGMMPPYGAQQPYGQQQGQFHGAMPNNGPIPNYGQMPNNGAMPNGGAYYQNGAMPGMNTNPAAAKKAAKAAKKAEQAARRKKVLRTLLIFLAVGLVLAIPVYILINKYTKQLDVLELPGVSISAQTSSSTTDSADVDSDGVEDDIIIEEGLSLADTTIEKGETWDGKSRITCLAMGLDYRDWVENDGTPRSDTMMLLTYDPVSGYAGMLSLPRDLWVAIPDHGYGRINTAYSLGEGEQLPGVDGKPGGGPGLAMRTVELFLGIDIQYYAVVDFYGFIDFIDTIDKLAINVRDDITVDPLGEGNTVHLMAGVQDLDGATALAYARYRYTEGGDFERAQRQQDVIYAIYEQMVWQLPELLTTKFDELFNCIQRAIKTNLTVNDMLKLAWTVVDIPEWKIERAVIAPPEQVMYDTSTDGQQILVPIPDKIREARDVIFANSFGAGTLTDDYTAEMRLADEAASITIVNGSTVAGIAEKTAEYLQQYGIKVSSIAAGTTAAYNALEIRTGKPYTAKFLADLMSIPTGAVTMNYDPSSDVDLVLTITDAWANSNPMP